MCGPVGLALSMYSTHSNGGYVEFPGTIPDPDVHLHVPAAHSHRRGLLIPAYS